MTGEKTGETIKFTHPYIVIEFFDRKYYKVFLKQDNSNWLKRLDDALERIEEEHISSLPHKPYYYLKRKEYDDFVELVDKYDRKDNNQEESESEVTESSSEESSTDDELIQKTLARRLTRESKGYENDEDHISTSELEDVISLSRRFRSVYKLLKNMAKRIESLENTVYKIPIKN